MWTVTTGYTDCSKKFISGSLKETQNIAESFAKTLKAGDLVAFRGKLGAGKTAFITGIALGFGIKEVSSPTFAIMNEYVGELVIHHYDMYRISGWEDLYSTGFIDDLDSGDALLLVEWSENIEEYLPNNCIRVKISQTGDGDSREIEIEMPKKGNAD